MKENENFLYPCGKLKRTKTFVLVDEKNNVTVVSSIKTLEIVNQENVDFFQFQVRFNLSFQFLDWLSKVC